MFKNKTVNFKDLLVSYFSMEIGIHPKIPTYSGGLGVLAGDMLRSCADLELPVIGVTLLYKKGYFKQKINSSGEQVEEEMHWNPEEFMKLFSNKITVKMEGRDVKVRAWLYEVRGVTGHVNPIIFLDTNLLENSEEDRKITQQLYGSDDKYRLSQEIILGIGGVRMLESLKCKNLRKYHMNEGHSALLGLELYQKLKSTNSDAMATVREKCVFTTHTPVPAGHDQFDKTLAEQMIPEMLTDDIKNELFLNGKLNMTFLGLRFSEYINGVAKKHGEVSRSMFPGYHIESITNGIHSQFWTTSSLRKLFDKYLKGWEGDPFSLRYVLSIPKEEIWQAHMEAKRLLTNFVNKNYGVEMNPDIFTIGFARRAATYKRGDMLFSDIERLIKIAKKSKGLQIIYAGKAHPRDYEGKQLIKRIIEKMNSVKDQIKVCYMENYDIETAQVLIPGVDVWLNTPMRPKEASGTSGMKAAHNGVPHFSTLDGWWLEGHIENVTGWSIGSHPMISKEANHDEDVEDMYTKLEYIIIPKFYDDHSSWLDIMRHAIAINGSFFNTHRMVQQYVLNAYFE
ncbi:MAG: alpha-glucan family phosphorylase [Nanoarchaeota archaeon]|nr:alpha-glucan family phosphorylase [Nanoarchaeota archaeon]MBU1030915.1 alpha-glucan family phosphorylase [Nanoarchaeota archaeon]MBU1850692.1 alpha-glucan family phosphorylase [Nanoarchaeota archaeon]